MQLLPQHFQLQGLRAEALAAHLAGAANPWFWGVRQLSIDPSALSAGQVRVLDLQATLPDGLVASHRAGEGPVLELDVSEAIAASADATVMVYLAVTPLARGGQWLPLQGRMNSLVGPSVPDLASGLFPTPINVWRPNLRLCTERTRADNVCVPLLKVSREGGGFIQRSYLPPTPVIEYDSPLGQRVSQLCARVREKALFLAGRLRQNQQAGRFDDAAEIRRQLEALWVRLPEVEGLLGSGTATPLALHGLLLGMAGAWSVLDPLGGVPPFAPLNFLDLHHGYDELLGWLSRTLELIRAGYRCLPFELDEQVYSLQLPDTASRQRLVVGLRMPAGASEQAAGEWLSRAIIASQAHVPVLARQRMSGLAHQAMGRQEQIGYSVGEDTRLFVVQATGNWFDPGQPLNIVAPTTAGGASPWQIVLFLNNPDAEA
ncbi:hypothetical protein PMM47T1_16590 [Pseudomonas sp. M47T1]|nr:hypothetical protein PMM47T1_16590 [Pseudomonas sp. M47T1]